MKKGADISPSRPPKRGRCVARPSPGSPSVGVSPRKRPCERLSIASTSAGDEEGSTETNVNCPNDRSSSTSTDGSNARNDVPEMFIGIERLRASETAGGAGLSGNDIMRLMEHGYTTVESIAFTPHRKLLNSIKSIGEQKVERMKLAASKLVPMGFHLASDSLKAREQMIRITTGSVQVDSILAGGIETGSITEVIGEFKSGKTQLCHTIAVTGQLPVGRGGAAGKVIYIDTEGTFRPERIRDIAERYKMDPEITLANIVVARAYNSDHQMKLIVESANVMASGSRFAVLVIDSATALFRSDYSGRGELAERQQSLSKFLRLVQRICDEFGTAVVMTNQVIANVDSGTFHGPASKPAGGHVIAHASQTRLILRKGMADKRICKVFDSPSLPETEATYFIANGGICDEEGGKKKHGAVQPAPNSEEDSD